MGRRRILSTERSGGGCYARDKKKVMETKKNIQKNDRKESGAGLAAGIRLENKTQQQNLWGDEIQEGQNTVHKDCDARITVNVSAGRRQKRFKELMSSAVFYGSASFHSNRKSYSVLEKEYTEKKESLKLLGVTKSRS